MKFFPAIACAAWLLAAAGLSADVLDDASLLQTKIDTALVDVHGGRWNGETQWTDLAAARTQFGKNFTDPDARALWDSEPANPGTDPVAAAEALGSIQGRLQHAVALEMLARQWSGDIEAAKEWRAVIKLPKFANAVEGSLALQRLGGDPTHRDAVRTLLAKECLVWQMTRAREKADYLTRLVGSDRLTPALLAGRAAEIQSLAQFPPALFQLATGKPSIDPLAEESLARAYQAMTQATSRQTVDAWRLALEATFPNLLSPEDVQRRERIVLKLLRLVPMEYQSGVRDGKVVIPIEYREAKSFTIQVQQLLTELIPVWRQSRPQQLEKSGPVLLQTLDDLEKRIDEKSDLKTVEKLARSATGILQGEFGLASKRAGKTADVVEEAVLEIRSLLGQSLAAAQQGQWRRAEALRLDAYVNFDLEIEARALPRDPELAIRAERAFLDGESQHPGIKAMLDRREKGDALTASYQRALDGLDECAALLKVGLSPTAAIVSTVIIVAREGLEAVVILAAILAGLRGVENAPIRRRIGIGAWLAIAASAVIFYLSQHLLSGLSRYGEVLETVISIIAVIILLIVTNWVFHKMYWVQWNAKLRDMSRAAQRQRGNRLEHLALVGVGFMTIFREGFETTLFMQSLILESGMRPVLIGLAIGGAVIGALGFAVFQIGARLPYRKMLIMTGVLVVAVLFTFVGSTVRLLQTVGWLPVHPIPGLDLPTWMGVWLGLYPTWEGLLIPFASFAYVGGMWLFVKFTARRSAAAAAEKEPGTVGVPHAVR